MQISLISIHPSPSPQSTPLATAFLKACAEGLPVTIELHDFFIGQAFSECARLISTDSPVAVGFSVYVWNRAAVALLAEELRKISPTLLLFCGGPEVTALPEEFLQNGLFDFVITGEGEIPFRSFCRSLSAGEEFLAIPGLLAPGCAMPQTPPPPVQCLDDIPSPYLNNILDTGSTSGILWQLSRGCSFTCDFCFDSRGIHGVRYFSLERIARELELFKKSSVSQVFVLDSTFNRDGKRAKSILKMIREYAPEIHFHFEVRSEFIDREMALLFSQISCSLQIGLQSADSTVLKCVGRSFNAVDFAAKVSLLNESGAVFGFDLMYGLPGDTLKGFCRSIDYAISLYPNHLDIFPLAVLPGTRLSDMAAGLQLEWERQPPYLLCYSDSFSITDMSIASSLATACDIFYTRGKAVAWFNAVARQLKQSPSKIFEQFHSWLSTWHMTVTAETDVSDDDIWRLQKSFLRHMFSGKAVRHLLPLVLDVASYHHYYAESLLSPFQDPCTDLDEHTDVPARRYELMPSVRIVHFTYEIDEILECGEPQFSWMYENLRPAGCTAVIFRSSDGVATEMFDPPYVSIIEQIRDGLTGGNFRDTGLSRSEITDFLQFSLQSGIITRQSL